MSKKFLKATSFLFIFSFCALPAFATHEPSLKVIIPKKIGAYLPGDSIEISWTPSSAPIQNITLITAEKGGTQKYSLYSNLVSGDPIITSGKFTYKFENNFIPSGSYSVGLGYPGTDVIAARSSKKIKVESKPSLYFGTKSGEVNSVAISQGNSITLKWNAQSVKKCRATSYPSHSKWKGSVKASGTKTIRVTAPTTFYLSCANKLGEVNSSLEANTDTPKRSNARLVPSSTFVHYNFKLGTTQNQAIQSLNQITLFNSSETEPIYFRFVTDDRPNWISTGYTTSQIMLPPNGTAGAGAFADPNMVSEPGTYTWNLKLEGNFSNSPLLIPITMTVTR